MRGPLTLALALALGSAAPAAAARPLDGPTSDDEAPSPTVAGALWSAWRLWRGRVPSLGAARTVANPGRLVAGNLLIALGTLVLSASGTLAGRLGKDRAFAITLLAGICILFAGFLVTSSPARRPATVSEIHRAA